jgi:hypothetical protein
MRLWSLQPRYLDPQGLLALWREAQAAPRSAINSYLDAEYGSATCVAVTRPGELELRVCATGLLLRE